MGDKVNKNDLVFNVDEREDTNKLIVPPIPLAPYNIPKKTKNWWFYWSIPWTKLRFYVASVIRFTDCDKSVEYKINFSILKEFIYSISLNFFKLNNSESLTRDNAYEILISLASLTKLKLITCSIFWDLTVLMFPLVFFFKEYNFLVILLYLCSIIEQINITNVIPNFSIIEYFSDVQVKLAIHLFFGKKEKSFTYIYDTILLSPREWFIKSYFFNKLKVWKKLIFNFIGYPIKLNWFIKQLNLSNFLTWPITYPDSLKLYTHSFFNLSNQFFEGWAIMLGKFNPLVKKINLTLFYPIFTLFSTFWWNFGLFLLKTFNTKYRRITLKFFSFFLPKWLYYCFTKLFVETKSFFDVTLLSKFSLRNTINFSFLINKHIHLDSISALLTSVAACSFSWYNLLFFYSMINLSYLDISIKHLFFVGNFEIFFFRKYLLYWSNFDFFYFLTTEIQKFLIVILNFSMTSSAQINNFLNKWFWFDYKTFFEELNHLLFELNFVDFEWIQELVWTKQLAELWLIKLTNYLKELWKSGLDSGNLQYSPDFTPRHEFALVFKWGLELEFLWITKIIILRWFFGYSKKYFFDNFIKWKMKILYKLQTNPTLSISTNTKAFTSELNGVGEGFLHDDINYIKTNKILSSSSSYELIKLTLSSILLLYRNAYKVTHSQVIYIHHRFKLDDELTIRNIYWFIIYSAKRLFYSHLYLQYYNIKKIKWWIGFWKMILKKVYFWFISNVNFFLVVKFFGDFFHKSLFLLFWWAKWQLWKLGSSRKLNFSIYDIVVKYAKSFIFPTSVSWNDYWFYLYSIMNIKRGSIWCDRFILPKAYQSFPSDSEMSRDMRYNDAALPILVFLLKNKFFVAVNNNYFNIKKNKRLFFFSGNQISNAIWFSTVFKSKSFWKTLTEAFSNFCSELFYEYYIEFCLAISRNKKIINSYSDSNLYMTSTSWAFSTLFFSFLSPTSEFFSLDAEGTQTLFFIVKFSAMVSANYKQLSKWFVTNLKKFLFWQWNLKLWWLVQDTNLLLETLFYLIKYFFHNKKYWHKLILAFYYWLFDFNNWMFTRDWIKLLFLNKVCLHPLLYNIEIMFLNFFFFLFKNI